jgi:CheY-like chemotaxis protein
MITIGLINSSVQKKNYTGFTLNLIKAELEKEGVEILDIPLKKFNLPFPGEELELDDNLSLSGTVLLVEDNKANQMLMEILLNELGLDVVISNDGLEAVEAFKTNKYDIILMDENMPNMNGIEATKIIRKLEKDSNSDTTPIIAVTANALSSDRERFINTSVGMDDYISKPIDHDELVRVLFKFLA